MAGARAWLLVIGVAACGGSKLERRHLDHHTEMTPVEVDVARTFVAPGEHTLMDLSWYGIPVAQIESAVGEPVTIGGRRLLVVWSELNSDGALAVIKQLHNEVTTTLDVGNGLPVETIGSFEALYSGSSRNSVPMERRTWSADERQHNTHSALFLLRSWDPPEGTRGYFTGRVGYGTYRADVLAAGRELLKTSEGTLPSVRIEGSVRASGIETYQFIVWFSDDRDRRPLRIEAESGYGGIVRAELVAYERD
jgi:hypothetical protein